MTFNNTYWTGWMNASNAVRRAVQPVGGDGAGVPEDPARARAVTRVRAGAVTLGRSARPSPPHTRSDANANVTLAYVVRRIGVFFLVVILAVSINFFIPRLRSTNPVEARMNEFAAAGRGQRGQYQGVDRDLQREVRPGQAAVGAVPQLLARPRPVRSGHVDRVLPGLGARRDSARGALDDRSAGRLDHPGVCSSARCWARCWPGPIPVGCSPSSCRC